MADNGKCSSMRLAIYAAAETAGHAETQPSKSAQTGYQVATIARCRFGGSRQFGLFLFVKTQTNQKDNGNSTKLKVTLTQFLVERMIDSGLAGCLVGWLARKSLVEEVGNHLRRWMRIIDASPVCR